MSDQKSYEDLLRENSELMYRLEQCGNLLKQAQCPNGCKGNCTWCYERDVEVKAYTK